MQITITNKQLAHMLAQTKIKDTDTHKVLDEFQANDEFSVEDFWLKTIETVGFRHYHQVNVFLQNFEKSGHVVRCLAKKKSQITGNKTTLYKKL